MKVSDKMKQLGKGRNRNERAIPNRCHNCKLEMYDKKAYEQNPVMRTHFVHSNESFEPEVETVMHLQKINEDT